MSTEPTSEETRTKRMQAPVQPPQQAPLLPSDPVPPGEDRTRRMDPRGATPAARLEDEIATRHTGTAPQPRSAHASASQSLGSPLGSLDPGTVLCGDCVVIRTHHNHESGRPGLFECQAPEGHVMVKVAATEFPPQPDLWRKLAELKHRHVLRIFRTVEDEGRFYEVQEFCTGGTLAEYVPLAGSGRPVPPADWIEKSLVPSFRLGISYLHAQGIVHRDIKPSNLYLREENGQKTLVIGDFDISSVLQTGRTSRSTDRAAGTWNYSAPEAFPRFIDEDASQLGSAVVRSSDYYSFGVVIVELLLGTTSLHQSRLPDLYEFYLQGGRVEIPDGLPDRLSDLLSGLLCRNRHRRWGSDEVARWLTGKTNDEDRQRIADDLGYQLGRSVAPFTAFESIKPTTLPELGRAMLREPKVALDELMSGDVMLNWIGQLDARIARLIRQDREKLRAHPDIVLLRARLHIDPSAPLPGDVEARIHSSEQWAKWAVAAVSRGAATPKKLCESESLLELEAWLRLKYNPEPHAADRLVEIAATYAEPAKQDTPDPIAPDPAALVPAAPARNPRLVLEALCWAFLPQKPFLVAPGKEAATPQEIVKATLGELADWKQGPPSYYASAHRRWQEGYLDAYLRERLTDDSGAPSPLLAQMHKVRQDFHGKSLVAFEIVLRLLDPDLPQLEIEFDPRAFENAMELPYGEEETLAIPFRTKGAGMPFAAVQLQSQWPGLQLETHEITDRRGQLTVRLYSQGDIPVGREYVGALTLAGHTTQLAGGEAHIRYKVTHPVIDTLIKIVSGAIIGAALMGGTRAILMTVAPLTLDPNTAALLARPGSGYILLLLALVCYIAYRIWLWALAKHAY